MVNEENVKRYLYTTWNEKNWWQFILGYENTIALREIK